MDWNQAQPQQYKILWGRIYTQIAEHFGYPANLNTKQKIHEEFKECLGYDTIQGISEEELRMYIWQVVATCAIEFGLYIILPDEPTIADELPLSELWDKTQLI